MNFLHCQLWAHIVVIMLCEVNPCIWCILPRYGHVFALAPDQLSLSQGKLSNYCAFLTQYGWWYQPGHWICRIWDIHQVVCWKNHINIHFWSYFQCKVVSGEFRQIGRDQILTWRMDYNAIKPNIDSTQGYGHFQLSS